MTKGKKIILSVSMLLILAIAAYLNFALTPIGDQSGENDIRYSYDKLNRLKNEYNKKLIYE